MNNCTDHLSARRPDGILGVERHRPPAARGELELDVTRAMATLVFESICVGPEIPRAFWMMNT